MFSSSTGLFSILPLPGYIEVAGAVRAVTTDAVLFVQVVRQGVEVRLFRHSLVERGVKYSNVFVFQLWERFQSFFDTDQVSRVVQRCKEAASLIP